MLKPLRIILLLFICPLWAKINLPLVITTWEFSNATNRAWEVLTEENGSGLDALVEGCTVCEQEQCDGTVGFGGSPDELGETTLDALVMDGSNMNIGAVAALRQMKDAIKIAKHVLLHTRHTMLVGDQATEFAEMMGFQKESLVTPQSKNMWKNWRNKNCQPNFWQNVWPDSSLQCGPYRPRPLSSKANPLTEHSNKFQFGSGNHDTISMIVIDSHKNIFAGTSTNGATHKIPGRVGDSPIPGAGAYADNEVGAAVSTGDGDVMMRFLPSFLAVESMRSGLDPKSAAKNAMKRIKRFHEDVVGGLIVTDNNGNYAAACAGMQKFPFSVVYQGQRKAIIEYCDCD